MTVSLANGVTPTLGRGWPGRASAVPAPGNWAETIPIPAGIPPARDSTPIEPRQETMTKSPDKALHKHIRILPEQWQRVEHAAAGTVYSANQLLVELAMEALDRRQSLDTEAELRVARASLFAAQAIARQLIADGRENEVQEIRDFISGIVPDPDADGPAGNTAAGQAHPSDKHRR